MEKTKILSSLAYWWRIIFGASWIFPLVFISNRTFAGDLLQPYIILFLLPMDLSSYWPPSIAFFSNLMMNLWVCLFNLVLGDQPLVFMWLSWVEIISNTLGLIRRLAWQFMLSNTLLAILSMFIFIFGTMVFLESIFIASEWPGRKILCPPSRLSLWLAFFNMSLTKLLILESLTCLYLREEVLFLLYNMLMILSC